MVRIWAKILKRGRIARQYMFERDENIDYSHFFDYLTEICYNLDCPTPVLIKTHIFNYAKYNYVRFNKDDFVEQTNFDRLVLENANL